MNQVIYYQKIESLFILIATVYFYHSLQYTFFWFFILLLSIDLCMLGYLHNNRVGAHTYNIGHIYAFPMLLLILGSIFGLEWASIFGLIWTAHIALDRLLGYGLKFESGFTDTHLGTIGKKRAKSSF